MAQGREEPAESLRDLHKWWDDAEPSGQEPRGLRCQVVSATESGDSPKMKLAGLRPIPTMLAPAMGERARTASACVSRSEHLPG
jgi:hypothetical protein